MAKSPVKPLLKNTAYKTWNQTDVVAAKFSKKALYYDQFADVQRFAASHLDDQIAENFHMLSPSNILEIGCGTAFYLDIWLVVSLRAKLIL